MAIKIFKSLFSTHRESQLAASAFNIVTGCRFSALRAGELAFAMSGKENRTRDISSRIYKRPYNRPNFNYIFSTILNNTDMYVHLR